MRKFKFTAMLLALLTLLWGCTAAGQKEQAEYTAPAVTVSENRLNISVVKAEDAYISTEFSQGQDSGVTIGYTCIGLTNVTITMDGGTMDLEAALQEGKTSLGEIASQAQADAYAGLCTESWESRNGLAKFCYSYPDYDLWITNDIYETPDGQQHLIRRITLCQPGSEIISAYSDLDQEDWGIEFSVLEATADSIILNYRQSGGQLIGQLLTCGYEISRLDTMEAVPVVDITLRQEQMTIPQNSQGRMELDLKTYFGRLPAGEYGMYLYLEDEYKEEDIPPLTRNYHDMQCYWIEFTVE